MLLTLASFIFVLGVLIFVHELGHFLAAKAVGIGVPRFSIGFGPPTPFCFQRGETEYVISWLPLGGYVKMASREEQEMMAGLEGGELTETFPPEKLFESKPLWARILVISAGVIMNALFAWGVYAGLALVYGRTEDPTTTLSRVERESLPEAALALTEVPRGTRIVRVGGVEVVTWDAIMEEVTNPRTKELVFDFDDGESLFIAVPGTDARARADIAGSMLPFWPARIGLLSPGKPAVVAGLELEDLIVAIDGEEIATWDDLVDQVEPNAGTTLLFAVERGDEVLEVPVAPAEETVQDPITGEARKVGRVGIGPKLDFVRVKFGVWDSVVEGGRRTADNAGMVLFALKGMFTGAISPKELGGPILIGQASGQFARRGVAALLLFMAFLSVNLAILNLLPIPVLDGGHLIFLFLEGLRGRPLALELRQRLTQAGVLVVLGIMVLALGNDLLRLLGVF